MLPTIRQEDQDVINVLLMTDHSLLGDALEDLLACIISLRVLRLRPSELPKLLPEIARLYPLIFIVDEGLLSDQLCEDIKIMGKNGRLQLITLSIEHNQVSICQINQFVLTGAADLAHIISTFVYDTPGYQQGDNL
jgi:hypothetical protein